MTYAWNDYQEEITRLYIKENKMLKEVRDIMKKNYNFDASVRSYRQQFDKWGVGKYNCKKRSRRSSPLKPGPQSPESDTSEQFQSTPAYTLSSSRHAVGGLRSPVGFGGTNDYNDPRIPRSAMMPNSSPLMYPQYNTQQPGASGPAPRNSRSASCWPMSSRSQDQWSSQASYPTQSATANYARSNSMAETGPVTSTYPNSPDAHMPYFSSDAGHRVNYFEAPSMQQWAPPTPESPYWDEYDSPEEPYVYKSEY